MRTIMTCVATCLVAACLSTSTSSAQDLVLRDSGSGGPAPVRYYIADVDNSGLNDVVIENFFTSLGITYIPDPGAPGALAAPVTIAAGSAFPAGALTRITYGVADMDGDGNMDVLASAQSFFSLSSDLYVIYGTGGGAFGPPVSVLQRFGGITAVVPGDFNGDGTMDLALSGTPGTEVWLQSNGTFTMASTFATTAQIIAADVDGDNDDDLVVLGIGGAFVQTGDPSGTIGAPAGTPFPSVSGSRIYATGDINGDGLEDLVVDDRSSGTLTIEVIYGDATTLLSPGPSLTVPSPTLMGATGAVSSIQDMDADGRTDLLIIYNDPTNIEISALRGDGNGNFSPAPALLLSSTQDFPRGNFVGDLDGDTDPDIVWFDFNGMFSRYTNDALHGAGCAGAAGVPTFSVDAAIAGNPAFSVALANAAPSSPSQLLVSTAPDTTTTGCGPLVDLGAASLIFPASPPWWTTTTSATGTASQTFSLPASISGPYYLQWAVIDPAGAFGVGGFQLSATAGRALRIF